MPLKLFTKVSTGQVFQNDLAAVSGSKTSSLLGEHHGSPGGQCLDRRAWTTTTSAPRTRRCGARRRPPCAGRTRRPRRSTATHTRSPTAAGTGATMWRAPGATPAAGGARSPPPAAAPPCSLHAACRTRAACLLGAEPCFPRRPAPPHAAPVSARRQPACVLKTGRCCSAQPGQPDQPWFAGVAGRSAYVERPRDGRCALHLLPTGGYVRASPAEPPRPGV